KERRRRQRRLLFYFISEPLTGSAPFVDVDIRLNMGFTLRVGLVPLFYLLFGCITSDAISFLNFPDQLLLLAVDDIDVIVCQFPPTLFYRTFHLFPFTLHLVRVHDLLLYWID